MSQPMVPTDHHASPTQVWTGLASELQEQAIRLMAQLAFNLVVAQSDSIGKEYTHDLGTRQTQDPA